MRTTTPLSQPAVQASPLLDLAVCTVDAADRPRRQPARPRFPAQFDPEDVGYAQAQKLAMQKWIAWLLQHYSFIDTRDYLWFMMRQLAAIEIGRELRFAELQLMRDVGIRVWSVVEQARKSEQLARVRQAWHPTYSREVL